MVGEMNKRKKTKRMRFLAHLLVWTILLAGCSLDEEEPTGRTQAQQLLERTNQLQSQIENYNQGKGTVISQENGEMVISRWNREQEEAMGDGDWTIFVYLCGSDLESEGGSASADIEEAFAALPSKNVRVVYETGGANFWYQDIDERRMQRYLLEDGDISLVDETPSANMGDASTLADFLEWGIAAYPAEKMALILWDHGSGSINGVCFDECYDYDSLSLKDIDAALSQVYIHMTDRFEFIGFDACLMSTVETANMLTPYARYLYASQEVEPGSGWDYTSLLTYLARNPGADGASLGKEVCDDYYEHCRDSGTQGIATFSVLDLSKMDDFLVSCNKAFQEIYELEDLGSVSRAILQADTYGGNSLSEGYSNMVDLGNMLDALSDYGPEVKKARERLDECVVYSVNGRYHEGASGLSIYYPLSIQGSEEMRIFSQICPCSAYYAFVDKIAYGAQNGSALGYHNSTLLQDAFDISQLFEEEASQEEYADSYTNVGEFADIQIGQMGVSDIYFDEDGLYTVSFDSMEELSYACCSVSLDDEEDGFFYLGTTEEIIYDYQNHRITDDFDGLWPCIDGNLLPLELVNTTDTCSTYSCNILLNGEEETNLRIEYDWVAGEWSVIGIWDGIDEDTGMASREVYELCEGDVITPVYYWTSEGDAEDWYVGDDYVVNGQVEITYDYLPEGTYYYCFELHDIYGNVYYTPFTIQYVDEAGDVWVDTEFMW